MKDQIIDQLDLYIWAKDKSYKYIYCSEKYAEAAGLDSPEEIVGKNDDQLPWRKYADFFRAGDYGVMQGHGRINSPEVSDTMNNVTDILVTENQLLTTDGTCVGVIGSFVDITGKQLVKKTGIYDSEERRYYLGKEFGDAHLTAREIQVFKMLVLGRSARQIGESLKIRRKTIESHIEAIKLKLQARTKGDVIETAVQFGLTQILHLEQTEMLADAD